jgi:septal ring factor EnvC (AmiA/AmiB activator)
MTFQDPVGSASNRSRQKTDIQREITIIEADRLKKNREKEHLEMEVRDLKKDQQRLEVELQDKLNKLKKIDHEVFILDGSINSLKKKLNLLV